MLVKKDSLREQLIAGISAPADKSAHLTVVVDL